MSDVCIVGIIIKRIETEINDYEMLLHCDESFGIGI